MRILALLAVLAATATMGKAQSAFGGPQPAYRSEVAATYQWVRTNTPNGTCNCFYLNGGSLSGAWRLTPMVSGVVDVSLDHASDVLGSGQSLTLSSYMAGPRLRLLQTWRHDRHTPEPYAQILIGAAHAGGGAAGAGDRSNVFAARAGGGMDLNLTQGFVLRLVQVDYDLTGFANDGNNHQNNLLVETGLVYRWSRLN
jgi:outer membrane immunogenic protein